MLSRGFDAEVLRDAAAGSNGYLPLGSGAWLRVLAPRIEEARPALIAGWAAARERLLGARAPELLEPA